jgi:hypothetical protein
MLPNLFSYDTEALNKQLLQTEAEDQLFVNTFRDTDHKKITLGVQQLYIIGNTYIIIYNFNHAEFFYSILFSIFFSIFQDFMTLFQSKKP